MKNKFAIIALVLAVVAACFTYDNFFRHHEISQTQNGQIHIFDKEYIFVHQDNTQTIVPSNKVVVHPKNSGLYYSYTDTDGNEVYIYASACKKIIITKKIKSMTDGKCFPSVNL